MTTVRDAFFDVLRQTGMTTVFSNPGSTEIPLLAGLPDDIRFVLSLHEGSVVGTATGYATGKQRPALVLLHTTAGLGNAVGALATARVNKVPLVVVVGQQDRRHLANEPFLTGHLEELAGKYPVWVATPSRAEDVPALVVRAHHEATIARGPAIVIVPMDDWSREFDASSRHAAPSQLRIAAAVDESLCAEVGARVDAASDPVVICGAGADDPSTWDAVVALASALRCRVWQEAFGARAGFPQDSPMFGGHLPAVRSGVRDVLAGHDLVLLVGAPALRQYGYEDGPFFADHADVIVLTDDAGEAARSVADLAVLTPLAPFCSQLAKRVAVRSDRPVQVAHEFVHVREDDAPLRAVDVFAALRERLPTDAVVVEESPSSRPELQDVVPARAPLGFLSAAMGGLGFGMPAAIGVKMACPDRPVVAVIGDGSAMYAPQSLWTAHQYQIGVLFVVMSNGGYAIMDRLARNAGASPAWPSFDVDFDALASSLGCRAMRIDSYDDLLAALDDLVPDLASRAEPLLLDVRVAP